MKPLHARYPFLADSRAAVEAAEVDLVGLVREDGPVVSRASERVTGALREGSIGDAHRSTRVELLSYPVARVLVSLVDERICTRKYANAEASRAISLFSTSRNDTTELASARTERLSLSELLAEFDLTDAVDESQDGYRVAVGTYLRLVSDLWGDEWRLVNRTLADGEVFIAREELSGLLEEAISQRVSDGLPLSVPEGVAAPLEDRVEEIRKTLAEMDLTREIDTVVPERFPPCMKALLDSVQKGEHLGHHSRFAITAFLTSIGMSTDEIIDLYMVNSGFGEEMTRYQTDHIRGETSPTEYTPPSCATMQSYGDCVNKDEICEEEINESHPLNYYEYQLDEADEDELVDWREEDGEAITPD
ncbi:DNA primase regulatory subunit PriL [Halalkalicoccus jeotgali]|uniref:DNA primase large subunit PriL n=1 Tax=Halalkalicoccus jeotgali (strain DSM 18796 / CECT 7217 / JCM 14584 / KCTC 4019 / B3) TaxID=795797 RepID=D8J5Z5_HALJB|nr:DNA primase regulatory subunit PriL [Halalkalicoccus jeotgali]ADJ13801.1 DNA primase, large subunit [Halalkalicoccus jeotgali B3]ELY34153.1 DNA primase large subunit [Halalkalicoccus jeotgali B3]